MKRIISAVINVVVSFFLLIAGHTFLRPCEGGMDMPCTYSTKMAVMLLILVIILNVGKLFAREWKGRLILSITTIAVETELVLIPKIGRCQVASMSCNTKTFPALCIGALLMIVLTIIFEIADLLGNRGKSYVHSK